MVVVHVCVWGVVVVKSKPLPVCVWGGREGMDILWNFFYT